ncbi:MAG: hypothetical protein NXI04_24810 [Planctomycetaceae bacterium]|nr:hypothetical protein [Planctomycetaceae bacterium]
MSLTIECEDCGYTGRVSPAKAGMEIPCPSCDQMIEVPDAGPSRTARRPKTDTSSTQYIVLGGAFVLLAGILTMMWVRKNQLNDDQLFDISPAEQAGQADANPSNPAGGESTTLVGGPDAESTPPDSIIDPDSPLEVTQVGDNGTVDQGDVILPEITAVAPETLLLAGMKEVVLQLEGFSEDTRGVVENAVTAEVQAELRKCRLTCVTSSNKPSFVVTLDLRQDGGVRKLGMSAELLGEVGGVPVIIWKHDAALIPLEDKALTGGVGLTGLDRQVARFFTPLRQKLTDARNSIEAIRRNRQRREEARRTPSGTSS